MGRSFKIVSRARDGRIGQSFARIWGARHFTQGKARAVELTTSSQKQIPPRRAANEFQKTNSATSSRGSLAWQGRGKPHSPADSDSRASAGVAVWSTVST